MAGNIVGVIKNCIFIFMLFITSFLGAIFILFPLFPMMLINRLVWRRVVDQIIALWLCLPVALMEIILGIRFRVTGDKMSSTENAVIIMNHRTRLDWLFLWSALYRMDVWLLTSEKIILKAPLRRILGAGWAMECNSFVFLERSLQKDIEILRDSARYLASTGKSYQILIFPEGTDLCPNTLIKSDEFAKSKHLPQYRHVLHPRTSGLVHLVNELRQNNRIKFIYDFTVAYPDGLVQTEMDLAKSGGCPGRVDFHCRRYRVDDIFRRSVSADGDSEQEDSVQLQRWCQQIWETKERSLERYYASNNNKGEISLQEACQDWAGWGDQQGESLADPYEMGGLGKAVLAVGLTYWMISVSFWLYSLYFFWWVKYFAAAGIAFFKLIEFRYSGVERFEIKMWERRSKRT